MAYHYTFSVIGNGEKRERGTSDLGEELMVSRAKIAINIYAWVMNFFPLSPLTLNP